MTGERLQDDNTISQCDTMLRTLSLVRTEQVAATRLSSPASPALTGRAAASSCSSGRYSAISAVTQIGKYAAAAWILFKILFILTFPCSLV